MQEVFSLRCHHPETYHASSPNEALPAGTLLRVRASTGRTLPSPARTPARPTPELTPPDATPSAPPTFETLASPLPARWTTPPSWDISPAGTLALALHPPPAPSTPLSSSSSALNPALHVFVRHSSLQSAPHRCPSRPHLHIRYYHQDHLGSSAYVTDTRGGLAEERAFYPYGLMRYEAQQARCGTSTSSRRKNATVKHNSITSKQGFMRAHLASYTTGPTPDRCGGALTSKTADP